MNDTGGIRGYSESFSRGGGGAPAGIRRNKQKPLDLAIQGLECRRNKSDGDAAAASHHHLFAVWSERHYDIDLFAAVAADLLRGFRFLPGRDVGLGLFTFSQCESPRK